MIYTNVRIVSYPIYFNHINIGGEILLLDEISKGSNMELEIKYNGKTMSFRSNIILVKSNAVLINTIKVNDQTVGFSEKCTINFLYNMDEKLYIWENVAVKLVKYEGIVYHRIDMFGHGKPYNRRENFRMYIGEDMPLYVNTAAGPTAIQVLVKDISVSGFAFLTTQEIDLDRIVRLKMKNNNSFHSLSAFIVRKEFITHLNTYLYGCKFHEKYAFLGKYIAQKQGELLRKKSSTISSPPNKGIRNNSIKKDKGTVKNSK